MLRSLKRLRAPKAIKTGDVRGHLSGDQHDVLHLRREHLRRELERRERIRTAQLTAYLVAPSREETQQIVARIIHDKNTYQEFRGQPEDGKGENGLKRTSGLLSIRMDAVDEDTDADVNPKRQRRFPVIDQDTMDWVSISLSFFIHF